MKYEYFVSYSHSGGFSSTYVSKPNKLTKKDIKDLHKNIAHLIINFNHRNPTILSIFLVENEEEETEQ